MFGCLVYQCIGLSSSKQAIVLCNAPRKVIISSIPVFLLIALFDKIYLCFIPCEFAVIKEIQYRSSLSLYCRLDGLLVLPLNCDRAPCSVHPSLGGAVAQSLERATPGQEVPGSIPAVAARSLLVGSVSV